MSSGEFVGITADNPDQIVELKSFHSHIINDHKTLAAQTSQYLPIPIVRKVTTESVGKNYEQIKEDVREIVDSQLAGMKNDPALRHLVVIKKKR
jgi:hypothetical protein